MAPRKKKKSGVKSSTGKPKLLSPVVALEAPALPLPFSLLKDTIPSRSCPSKVPPTKRPSPLVHQLIPDQDHVTVEECSEEDGYEDEVDYSGSDVDSDGGSKFFGSPASTHSEGKAAEPFSALINDASPISVPIELCPAHLVTQQASGASVYSIASKSPLSHHPAVIEDFASATIEDSVGSRLEPVLVRGQPSHLPPIIESNDFATGQSNLQ